MIIQFGRHNGRQGVCYCVWVCVCAWAHPFMWNPFCSLALSTCLGEPWLPSNPKKLPLLLILKSSWHTCLLSWNERVDLRMSLLQKSTPLVRLPLLCPISCCVPKKHWINKKLDSHATKAVDIWRCTKGLIASGWCHLFVAVCSRWFCGQDAHHVYAHEGAGAHTKAQGNWIECG